MCPSIFNSPDIRLREILTQFQAPIVLTSPGCTRVWPKNVKHVVQLDININMLTGTLSTLPMVPPNAVAYCVFTSGTTGSPKGVRIEHRAYLTSAIGRLVPFKRSSTSRILQVSSFCSTSLLRICVLPSSLVALLLCRRRMSASMTLLEQSIAMPSITST
jgi:non-ribosomal peptide synthetase component F